MTFDGLGACCKFPSVASLTTHLSAVSHSWQALSESSKSLAFVKKLFFSGPPRTLPIGMLILFYSFLDSIF